MSTSPIIFDDVTQSLLESAGYRVEGPGDPSDPELAGRHWWTLTRPGWSGIECGRSVLSAEAAWLDALATFFGDEDIDFDAMAPRTDVRDRFPANFDTQLREWILAHSRPRYQLGKLTHRTNRSPP
jgi:hypothetical protein